MHIDNAGRGTIVKTVFINKSVRVNEGAEQHLDHRQFTIVVAMTATLVVHAAGFRTHHDITRPARRTDIGM